MPIVSKYFQKFTAVQWCMLATEAHDSALLVTLSDMMRDIVQTLTTTALRTIKPVLEKVFNTASPVHLQKTLENINILQGESLLRIFADALAIPKHRCRHAEELTALVEREVSEKISSISSAILNCSVLPPEPAFYVDGFMSNTNSLQQIVCCAALCLKELTLRALCCGGKPSQRKRYKISEAGATEAVIKILLNCCKTLADPDPPTHNNTVEAHNAAADIVSDISENLRCGKSTKEPNFDMRSIFKKIRAFIEGNITDVNKGIQERRFSGVARKLFAKMLLNLRIAFKEKGSQFLVSLKSNSQRNTVRHSTRPTRRTRWPTVICVKAKQSSEDLAVYAIQHLANIDSPDMKMEFSKELNYKVYHHLVNPTFTMFAKNCRFSGTVITECLSKADFKQSGFPPKVLYVKTEDAVQRFVQQVLLCMKNNLFEKRNHNETLSGVMADIEVMITNMVNKEENTSTRSGSSRTSLLGKCKAFCSAVVSTTIDYKVVPQDDVNPQNSLEDMKVIIALSKKTHRKIQKLKNLTDISTISQRLSDWLENKINIPESADKKLIAMAVVEDLLYRFCSPDVLWEAGLTSDYQQFDDAVITYLFLKINYPRSQKKGRIQCIYSSTKKALTLRSLLKRISKAKAVPSTLDLDCIKLYNYTQENQQFPQ